MAAKTTDWRPGPTVCRCCLSEGCYKDISTEYFWMGKREVYSEMLSETFSLSIAYSTSGGPNSNSRLICEPCISRLRDASDFKRQVQECEKTFMQYLDPGTERLSDFETAESRIEVTLESLETEVKVEQVKTEKDESDGDDFGDRTDFPDLDDDDDDLDDQPLTRLATRVPKKESVDTEADSKPEKRKATTKAKTSPAKKAKTKKEVVKATTSKAAKPTEKKKKGDGQKSYETFKYKKEIRNRALALISSSDSLPFRIRKHHFSCFYCEKLFKEFLKLEQHNATEHSVTGSETTMDFLMRLPAAESVNVNFRCFTCKLCAYAAADYKTLREHLNSKHDIKFNQTNEWVIPYHINSEDFKCVICPESFAGYKLLNQHMNTHFRNFVCHNCGVGFTSALRLRQHAPTHVEGKYKCELCDKVVNKIAALRDHVQRIHKKIKKNKCPHCDETFRHYNMKITHMVHVHGAKVPEYKCDLCPKVYLVSGRLKCHMKRAHTNIASVTTHECKTCERKFTTNQALKEHLVCHSEEKQFECQVCHKKFSRKKVLKTHMRIHNNDRRFVCKFCSKSFVYKCGMTNHIKTQHRNEVLVESDDD
ncbi:zinc finger protein 37-like isoform X18 [Ostrinia nubilalis]|uniref:zinc finger protein 37-like isoform X18 n=1 Tax=Ostrinia nubilalis TaxID=29057 RepID=UPI00308236CF